MFLTPAEVATLTRREQPAAQRRVLDAMGVRYRVHPFDGSLIVARAAVESWLGVEPSGPANEEYDVDTEALERYGKKTTVRES